MPEKPANGYDVNGLYRLIHDVYVLLDYGDRLVLDQFGLNSTQFRLLNLVNGNKGLRHTVLSDRLIRSKSQVSRVVDTLVEQGLVERFSDPEDRRVQHVVLTRKGSALRKRVNEAHLKSLEARFKSVSGEQEERAIKILTVLKHGMANYLELE